jgi:hypothetical protein
MARALPSGAPAIRPLSRLTWPASSRPEKEIDVTIAQSAQNIRDIANAANSQWPQYRGHWDGPEWKLVQMSARTRTKLGVAFEAGDITLAHRDPQFRGWFAYSVRNNIDTLVSSRKVREIK